MTDQDDIIASALKVLDDLADSWATEIDVDGYGKRIAEHQGEGQADAIAAMMRQSFIEGAYRMVIELRQTTLEEYEDIGNAAVECYRANSAGDAAGLAVLALVSRVRELEHTFKLRYAAGRYAIDRWHKAHPDQEIVWPDHADLCLWLMCRVRELEAALAAEAESHEMTRAEYQEALEESALGPVMPETPSDHVRRAFAPWCDGYACEDNLWATLRNALIEEKMGQ